MKKIAIFLKEPGVYDYPFSKDDYLTSYTELCEEIIKAGGDPYIVRSMSTYLGKNMFTKSWKLSDKKMTESGQVTADIIFDRGEFSGYSDATVFNPQLINTICTDKWLMYQKFSQYCPRTWKVANRAEFEEAVEDVSTELVVSKPIDGQEGQGVLIGSKQEVLGTTPVFPSLVQEFLDSSVGIPGIVEGLHDFRVALVNGEPFYAYFRTPPSGSYLANVARGGKFSMIDPTTIPEVILQMVQTIDTEMSKAGSRFYGIDFAMTKDGPKIIEMNSRLGLLPNSDDQVFKRLKETLANILVDNNSV